MSKFTPPVGTAKDVNDRLRRVTGLDPDDPNDMAFKLVTILYFFCVSQKLTFFLRKAQNAAPPLPPRIGLSTNAAPPPASPFRSPCTGYR